MNEWYFCTLYDTVVGKCIVLYYIHIYKINTVRRGNVWIVLFFNLQFSVACNYSKILTSNVSTTTVSMLLQQNDFFSSSSLFQRFWMNRMPLIWYIMYKMYRGRRYLMNEFGPVRLSDALKSIDWPKYNECPYFNLWFESQSRFE